MIKNSALFSTIFHFMSLRGIGPVQTNKLLLSLDEYSPISFQDLAFNFLTSEQKAAYAAIKDDPIEVNPKFDVRFVLLHDELYPSDLRESMSTSTPPVLSIIGNEALLNKKKVAFSGSRNVSDKGIKITEETVESLVKEDVVIVSGYAKGVDFSAHYTALKHGGSTIIVLPEGINHFRIKSELKDVWDWDRVLVISEFQPHEKWMASRAMKRNLTIIALSDAVVVVEAGATGGSIDAGNKTLEKNKALFVPHYSKFPASAEGNPSLLHKGAIPLRMNKETMKPNIGKIIEVLQEKVRSGLF